MCLFLLSIRAVIVADPGPIIHMMLGPESEVVWPMTVMEGLRKIDGRSDRSTQREK
jgi:hypothetical protein